jgi:hypothetical protein
MNYLRKLSPFFIIKFPNGKRLLYRSEVIYWAELVDVVKYFKDEYGDETTVTRVTKRDAKKFLKGELF